MPKLTFVFRRIASVTLALVSLALLLLALLVVVAVSDDVTTAGRIVGLVFSAVSVTLALLAAYWSWRLWSYRHARRVRDLSGSPEPVTPVGSTLRLWAACRTFLLSLAALAAAVTASLIYEPIRALPWAAAALALSVLTVLSSERLSKRFSAGAEPGWWRKGGFLTWFYVLLYASLPLVAWISWFASDDREPWRPPAYDTLHATTGVLKRSERELSIKPKRGERVYIRCVDYRHAPSCADKNLDRHLGRVVTVRHEPISDGGIPRVLAYEIRAGDEVLLSFAEMVEDRALADAYRAEREDHETGFLPTFTTILMLTPLILPAVQRPRWWQRSSEGDVADQAASE